MAKWRGGGGGGVKSKHGVSESAVRQRFPKGRVGEGSSLSGHLRRDRLLGGLVAAALVAALLAVAASLFPHLSIFGLAFDKGGEVGEPSTALRSTGHCESRAIPVR